MPEPECTCEGAGHCPRYGLDQSAHHVHLCRTQPAYRELWAARKGLPVIATAVASPPAEPMPVRAPTIRTRPLPVMNPVVKCYLEGEIVEECTGCKSNRLWNHVRECNHPDNDDGRCKRGRTTGEIWSCQACPPVTPAPRSTSAPAS